VHVEGDLTLEKARQPLIADDNYVEPLSITNSFGVPSRVPAIWQEDAKKAAAMAHKGQVMVLSFMGTVKEGQTADEFVDDLRMLGNLRHRRVHAFWKQISRARISAMKVSSATTST